MGTGGAALNGPEDGLIASFWAWWESAKDGIFDALSRGELAAVREPVRAQVAMLSPELGWDLSAGREARYALCLSARGAADLRVLALRWAAMAPAADANFEYSPHRIANPGAPEALALRVGLAELRFSELVLELQLDPSREALVPGFYHPALLGQTARVRALLMVFVLESTVGEDGLAMWVRRPHVLDAPPERPSTLSQLREGVGGLARVATGARWEVLHGRTDEGLPVLISANRALKRWAHPEFMHHAAVRLEVKDPDANGMPKKDELLALNHACEELERYLSRLAVCAFRETSSGLRVVHLFTNHDGPVPEMVGRWANKQRDRAIEVLWDFDPEWSARRAWM